MNSISIKLDAEKAYLLGLLIGGGIFKSNHLQIVLPYKNWGDLKINPQRGGDIAEDILKRVKPLWKLHYDVDIFYKIGTDWKINFSEVSQKLKDDLAVLGLYEGGEFREVASIEKLKLMLLSNKKFAKSFITGIVDTVGSLATSHRRFTADSQIISMEFKGRNFRLVCDIAELLSFIGCKVDQILWNHPNQHSGLDRYYKSWKKGFKIRTLLDEYLLSGGFVFQAKQLSANENQKIQKVNNVSKDKESRIAGRTCVHVDQNSSWLPINIRGLHFIHFTHIAMVLGATSFQSPISENFNFGEYICPFTILTKGSIDEINKIIDNEKYLRETRFSFKRFKVQDLISTFDKTPHTLLFGRSVKDGFPLNYILQGISFVLAKEYGGKVKGKRVLGNYLNVLKELTLKAPNIEIGIPERGTCLLIQGTSFGALVGYFNDEFNNTLIKKDGIKIVVQNPIYNDCVKL